MFEEQFESAEFYHRRYHNYSVLLIIPTTLLFLFLLLFMFFAKKEIIIKTTGSVEPIEIIANIQSTSSNEIIENKLEENALVNVGDLLLEYSSVDEGTQKDVMTNQLSILQLQKESLETLIASLENDSNYFALEDDFGYAQQYKNYENQRLTLIQSVNQENGNISLQNDSYYNTREELETLISYKEKEIEAYRLVSEAIQNNQLVSVSSLAYDFFYNYLIQESQLSDDLEKDNLKAQTLVQLSTTLSQLQSELSSYRLQYTSLTRQGFNDSLTSQLSTLKASELVSATKELSSTNKQILELEGESRIQTQVLEQIKIKAPNSGVVHLNSEVKNLDYIQSGTLIAQLYPDMATTKKVKLVTYISSNEISGLVEGNRVRLTLKDENNKEFIMASTISHIDSVATTTESGNLFKVEAEADILADQINHLRYGMEGKMSIVTGKQTFASYYWKKITG